MFSIGSLPFDRESGRYPKLKKNTASHSCTIYARAASSVIRQFSKSLSAPFILFMSASSNYVYIQRRGYRIWCSSLRVEIRNNSDFLELLIWVEIGLGCLFLLFFFQPNFDNFLIELLQWNLACYYPTLVACLP